jgi:hypothetical protein
MVTSNHIHLLVFDRGGRDVIPSQSSWSKEQLGIRAKGREVRGMEGQFELREPEATYNSHFGAKKADIGPENTWE